MQKRFYIVIFLLALLTFSISFGLYQKTSYAQNALVHSGGPFCSTYFTEVKDNLTRRLGNKIGRAQSVNFNTSIDKELQHESDSARIKQLRDREDVLRDQSFNGLREDAGAEELQYVNIYSNDLNDLAKVKREAIDKAYADFRNEISALKPQRDNAISLAVNNIQSGVDQAFAFGNRDCAEKPSGDADTNASSTFYAQASSTLSQYSADIQKVLDVQQKIQDARYKKINAIADALKAYASGSDGLDQEYTSALKHIDRNSTDEPSDNSGDDASEGVHITSLNPQSYKHSNSNTFQIIGTGFTDVNNVLVDDKPFRRTKDVDHIDSTNEDSITIATRICPLNSTGNLNLNCVPESDLKVGKHYVQVSNENGISEKILLEVK